MPNDAVPKPTSSPILDRFRELLRERDEELRASSYDGVVPPLTTNEIVPMYEDVLCELSFNSKPLITDLTIIAGEQREHAVGIADAISARVVEAPVEQKLPSLYLLDSIVKNIGREYIRHFSTHLPEVFCEAYKQAPPDMKTSMQHLFRTWSTVFSSSVLRVIEVELQFPPPVKQQSSGLANAMASQSSRPLHGIHVNPKYLEGRGQIDSEPASSNVNNGIYKTYAQKATVGYDDNKSDKGEGALPSVYGGRVSIPLGSEKLLSSVGGPARVTKGNGDSVNRKRRNEVEKIDTSDQGNGHKRDRTRALIDAYGQDNEKRTISVHPHKFGSRVMVARPWQHIEEEEFDWEDMNPTLGTDMLSSEILRARYGVDSSTLGLRKSWPGDTRMSDDSSKIAEDAAPSVDAAHGSLSNHNLLQDFVGKPASGTFPGNIVSSSASLRLPVYDSLKNSALPLHQQVPSGLPPPANFPNPQVPPSGSNYPPHALNNKVMNQGPQQFNNGGIKNPGTENAPPHLPPVHLQQQFLRPQEPWQGRPMPPRPSQGYFTPAYRGNMMMNPIPPLHPSNHPPHISSSSFQQGMRPPFPSGPPPVHPPFANSGFINSLVAQGVISLTNQPPVQDSLGVEFNLDLLKVRHESVIRGLYADLPRQCTTCALRFKTQDEHSKHMDWHVTKNRISKNRKQNPSRKWFVSTTMWLSGAEALGTDAAPNFFLPTDTAEEKQDEELAVVADDSQKTCALCGEAFEDFYSDETDEWMYRGAVYLNAPGRSTAGMDISQVGPIIHAKCRSESGDVPT